MTKIGFPISTKDNERRRALLPEDLSTIEGVKELVFEIGYGNVLGYSDDDYIHYGATVADRDTVSK